MKTIYFSRGYVFSLITLLSLPIIFSCTKTSETDDSTYAIMGNASGLQEVPANTSPASGALSGTYNAENNTLQYNIDWKTLSGMPTTAHFHETEYKGDSTEAIIEITISADGINGSATGIVILTDSAEAALLNGNLYYDVQTPLYPNGEIRGQVIALRE
jgi:hypothetical protein